MAYLSASCCGSSKRVCQTNEQIPFSFRPASPAPKLLVLAPYRMAPSPEPRDTLRQVQMKASKAHLVASLVLTSRCPDISAIICDAKQAIATAPGSREGVAQGCVRPWATLHILPCMAFPLNVMAMCSTRHIAAGQGFGAPTSAIGAVRLRGAFPQ